MTNQSVRVDQELIQRLRSAIQFCKTENSFTYLTDVKMPAEERLTMEHCLVKNYLLVHGMDYFGKRDLIYIDMEGDQDVKRLGLNTIHDNPLFKK